MTMAKEDRLLQFMALFSDSNLALPPSVAHRNARFRGATWERSTTDNYLSELVERDWLQRVDPNALDEDRDLVEVPEHKRAYYIVTSTGRREYREATDGNGESAE